VSKEEKLRRQIGKAQHRKTPPPLKNDPVWNVNDTKVGKPGTGQENF
jgi:hypothetical protein